MSRKHHKIAQGDQEGPMIDPAQDLALDTIEALRASLVKAREADLLSAEDLAEARRVLHPVAETVNDWQTWYGDVGRVKELLARAHQRGSAYLSPERAEELRRLASEEDSAAAQDPPDMGSTAD